MSIFDKFETKEDVLAAVEQEIAQDEEQKFYIPSAVDKSQKYVKEIEQSQNYRHRAQDAEERCSQFQKEVEERDKQLSIMAEQVKQYQASAGHSEELQTRVQQSIEEKSRLLTENKELLAKIAPLEQLVADYKQKDTSRRIQNELETTAKKLKIVPSAYRDVCRLGPEFYIDEIDGVVRTKDGLTVEQRLEAELQNCPHWMPISEGGGSSPGNASGTKTRENEYKKARESGDIDSLIRFAPTLN